MAELDGPLPYPISVSPLASNTSPRRPHPPSPTTSLTNNLSLTGPPPPRGAAAALPAVRRQGGEIEAEDRDMAGVSTSLMKRDSVLSYGVGHMLNDLTAACWFTYLLIFLTDIGLTPKQAAAVMMSGQLADAISTLIVGRLIDDHGRFKQWHAGGSLLVAVSFSSVFGGCAACAAFGPSDAVRTLSYSVSAAVFNCGWAATQVSHMSLVNCITANPTSRVALNSCRNAFTMVANLGLYVLAYVAFRLLPGTDAAQVQMQFRWIASSAVVLGLLLMIAFYAGVREPKLCRPLTRESQKASWAAWFRRPLYYQVALVYVLTRLTTNVSQTMLPFFLVDDLRLGPSSKALVPALVYLSSFGASLLLQELSWSGRRLKAVFCGGAALWLLSGAIFFAMGPSSRAAVYVLALLVGVGNALMLVTATSMEGALVGQNLSGCAFVYGSLSFLDKLTCGIALYSIEAANVPHHFCNSAGGLGACHKSLAHWVLALVPAGCALLAAAVTIPMDLDEHRDAGAPRAKSSGVEKLSEPLLLSRQVGAGHRKEVLV